MNNKYTRIPNEKLFVNSCQVCGLSDSWQEKKLSLVLDHINGVKKDNRLSNLRFVCPNCDSQLPTFKSKNIKYQRKFNLSGYDPDIYKDN